MTLVSMHANRRNLTLSAASYPSLQKTQEWATHSIGGIGDLRTWATPPRPLL